MSGYVRPAIADDTYRDGQGAVIEYGSRWGVDGPPEDSYSVVSHPQRFAPLHEVALALVDYLQRTYAVEVLDELSCLADLWRPRVNAVRAVRLTPATADAASMTFVLTDHPGVIVHAGLVHDFVYPVCGCDACDETWQSVADDLEHDVQAIVSGGYREEVRGGRGAPWIWTQLRAADGSQVRSGGAEATGQLGERLRAASARLAELPAGWAPWPPR